MKTQQLVSLFTQLKGTGKTIRFADLLRAGYSSYLIKHAIEQVEAEYSNDEDGYTLIIF